MLTCIFVQATCIRAITNQEVSTYAGTCVSTAASSDGPVSTAIFKGIHAITVDFGNILYIAESVTGAARVRRIINGHFSGVCFPQRMNTHLV